MKRSNRRTPIKRSSPIRRSPPPPAPSQSSNKPTLGSTIKEGVTSGMSFGVGSAIAHRAMDAIVGPRKIEVENKSDNTCQILMENYSKCLENNFTINKCDEISNLLKTFKCSVDNNIN